MKAVESVALRKERWGRLDGVHGRGLWGSLVSSVVWDHWTPVQIGTGPFVRRSKPVLVGAECVICGTAEDIVRHHKYGRKVDSLTVSMCKWCESAVHGRRPPRAGTDEVVAGYQACLPEECVLRRGAKAAKRNGSMRDEPRRARRKHLQALRTLADVVKVEQPDVFQAFLCMGAGTGAAGPVLND